MLIPVKLTLNSPEIRIGELLVLKKSDNKFFVVNYENQLVGEIKNTSSNSEILKIYENILFSVWGIFKNSLIIEIYIN